MIYPREDETWALFKDWDSKSITDAGNHKKYKYEIVQNVSDFVEGAGIRVAFLGESKRKVFQKGVLNLILHVYLQILMIYVTLSELRLMIKISVLNPTVHVRKHPKKNELKLSESEIKPKKFVDRKSSFVGETCIVRWSPRGLKIAEKERIHASANNASLQTETVIPMNGKGSKSRSEFFLLKSDVSVSKSDKQLDLRGFSEDFHDFKEERSEGKFRQGQIWALHAPEHKLPKMYGQIKKIGRSPFTLYVAALESSSVPEKCHPACLWSIL
ncbi:uncharacterized protein [Coffea arabica]|uniref:DUF3444 domain-containing protein n=1 Tax=Coffea arabica TaxID=13443 RepID=A0ABM4W902_COFAR